MPKRVALTIALLALFLSACTKRGPDPAVQNLAAQAGDGACLTVLVQPDRWARAAATLRPLLLGLPIDDIQPFLAAEDPWTAVRSVLEPARQKELPTVLDGWDQSRPIVIALFEPQVGDLVLAARSLLPLTWKQIAALGLDGIRHRVLVPATDPATLTRALTEIVAVRKLKAFVADAAHPALAGGTLFFLPGGQGFVAIIPAADHVRVEILSGEFREATAVEERLAAWSRLLAAPRPAKTPPTTPAWIFATGEKRLLTVYLRPWVLRDLGSQLGTSMVLSALTHAAIEYRMQLLAAGLSEVARGYLLMTPENAEMDDLAFGLDVDGAMTTTAVASLTERGQRIYEAGLAAGRAPFLPSGDHLLLTAWSRLDFNAMLQAAGTLPVFSAAKNMRDLTEPIQECGYFCPLHFLLRSPFGLGRTLVDFLPAEISQKFPRAFSLSILRFDPQNPTTPLQAAAAVHFPAGFNTRLVREALATIERRRVLGNMRFELFTDTLDGDEIVQLGLGVDPRQVFGAPAKGLPETVLGEARIAFGGLANLLNRESPAVASALDQLDSLQGRSSLVGRTLIGQSVLAFKGKPAPAFADPAMWARDGWTSPAPSDRISKGERCMQEVTRGMIEAFRALAMVAPAQRSTMLVRALTEVDGPLSCALAEADTRELASRTQAVMALYASDLLGASFQPDGQLQVLDRACGQGHQEACQRSRDLRAHPQLSLAQVEAACAAEINFGQEQVLLGTAAAAEEYRPVSGLDQPALVFGAGVPYGAVGSVLGKLAEIGEHRPSLVVQTPSGSVKLLEIELPGAKPVQPGDFRASLPAAWEEAPAQRSKTPLVLQISGAETELWAKGESSRLPGQASCASDGPCLDLGGLGRSIDRLRQEFGDDGLAIHVQATPETPFGNLAAAVGLLACAGRQQKYGRSGQRPVILGPVPQEIAAQAKSKRAENELARQAGILAILKNGNEESVFDSLGDGSGVGGLGLGGGGLGSRGGPGGKAPPRIRTGQAAVRGSLSKEIIRRVLQRNQAQIRYCYEKELVKKPDLQGKITVKFVIGKDGGVQSASIDSSTMKNASVEACLTRTIRRMRFPSPTGGGIVIVNYPWVFKSAE